MLLLNVIFPAPSAVYVTTIFTPVATLLALTAEFLVFCHFQRGIVPLGRLAAVVLVLNVFSWVPGFLCSALLPSGIVPKLVGDRYLPSRGPHFDELVAVGFVFACVVSAALEYGALRWMFRRMPLRSHFWCVAVANVVSYLLLGAAYAS